MGSLIKNRLTRGRKSKYYVNRESIDVFNFYVGGIMLEVNIEKIVPVTEGRDMFNKIVDDVEGTNELWVLTKNGKPTAVVVGVNHLEKLTGQAHGEVVSKIEEATASNEAPEAPATAPSAPEEEESETVFASAYDAPAAADPAAQAPDPFAMAASQLATQNIGAVASAADATMATPDTTPIAPSTESTGEISKINPVPEGFGTTFATPAAPSQDRPADEDSSVIEPEENPDGPVTNFAPDPLATPPTTQFASADDANSDNAAGPTLPPTQAA